MESFTWGIKSFPFRSDCSWEDNFFACSSLICHVWRFHLSIFDNCNQSCELYRNGKWRERNLACIIDQRQKQTRLFFISNLSPNFVYFRYARVKFHQTFSISKALHHRWQCERIRTLTWRVELTAFQRQRLFGEEKTARASQWSGRRRWWCTMVKCFIWQSSAETRWELSLVKVDNFKPFSWRLKICIIHQTLIQN